MRSERTYRYWNPKEWPRGQSYGDNSCVGHAWCDLLACMRHPAALDPKGVYEIARLADRSWDLRREGVPLTSAADMLLKLGIIKEYASVTSASEAAEHLLRKGPLITSINWYASMTECARNGFLEVYGEASEEESHACIYNGYSKSQQAFRLRCAWTGWGRNGYAKVRLQDVARFLREDCELYRVRI